MTFDEWWLIKRPPHRAECRESWDAAIDAACKAVRDDCPIKCESPCSVCKSVTAAIQPLKSAETPA